MLKEGGENAGQDSQKEFVYLMYIFFYNGKCLRRGDRVNFEGG